jgi:holo-[acyl-carrier-protein] synthase
MLTVGVDLIEIARIEQTATRFGRRFLERVFTPAELAYCAGRAPCLAARWTAKEATAKALGTGIGNVAWREIEVVCETNGRPALRLHGRAAGLAASLGLTGLAVSLSHSQSHAIACVVGWKHVYRSFQLPTLRAEPQGEASNFQPQGGIPMTTPLEGKWALILGASSGFGAACALELARNGMNIFGVHLDLKATLPLAKQVMADIEATGRRAVYFNTNAADHDKRQKVLDSIQQTLGPGGTIHVMLHSLAFGTLLPFIANRPEEAISPAQMEMTLDVMAHSLVYWVQDLHRRRLLTRGSRIFSMTSAGSHRVIRHYGAVSAAKAALESHTRQLALELAPEGIIVNSIQAGVTDTPALRKIPGNERIVAEAIARNPGGRITTPQDVAQTIAVLCDPRISWLSGEIIRVDGGEDIV